MEEGEEGIIYGPVSSWRLGRSLGVDIICETKVCSYNCRYCQLDSAGKNTLERNVFLSTEKIIDAVEAALEEVEADVVTLAGSGEPTLAANLGEIIKELQEVVPVPVAVLTNGSLMSRPEVRAELATADIVKGKLDAPDSETFQLINQPAEGVTLPEIIEGMRCFARETETYFMLEVMFTAANMDRARDLARLAEKIDPDEIQINTPRRESPVEPLTNTELDLVKIPFQESNLNFKVVHEQQKPDIEKILGEEKFAQIRRRKASGD